MASSDINSAYKKTAMTVASTTGTASSRGKDQSVTSTPRSYNKKMKVSGVDGQSIISDSGRKRSESSANPLKGRDAVPQIVSLESCLAVVALASRQPMTNEEKSLLTEFRRWGPVQELEIVRDALNAQKDALLAK